MWKKGTFLQVPDFWDVLYFAARMRGEVAEWKLGIE